MSFTIKPAKGEELVNREELEEKMLSELEDKSSTVGYDSTENEGLDKPLF